MVLFGILRNAVQRQKSPYNVVLLFIISDFLIFAFLVALFILIQSIVGTALSFMSRKKGDFSGISQAGKVLGIISTVFAGISVILSFIALVM